MGYGGKQSVRSGDIRRFNFTGNGSNTAFDLGFTPATQNQLIVTVNGLVQHYDAFSISGSTLTFTGTPGSGDAIQVTAVVDAVGVAAIPDGAIANVSTLTVSGNTTLSGALTTSTNTATFGTSVYHVANGNLGIGTSTPAYSLQAKGGGVGITSADGTVTNLINYNSIGTITATDFVLTSNNATRVSIVANGAVGIGADPYYGYKLAVNGTIVATNGLYVEGGTRGGYTTSITNDGGNNNANNAFRVMNASGNILLNSTYGGQVTTPYQPAFRASKSASPVGTSENPVQYDTVDFNIGSHYNNSTYRFTAPVAGRYFMTAQFSFYQNGNARQIEVALKLNGTVWQATDTFMIQTQGNNTHCNATVAAVMNLAAGDYVQGAWISTTATINFYSSGLRNTFSGFLIG